MKIPLLKRDTVAEIRKTTDELATAGAKLAALREERSRLLVDSDDLTLIKGADTNIGTEERYIATLRERLQKLEGLRRKERRVEREAEKERAVAAFEKEYQEKRVTAATEIIEALGKFGDAWVRYAKTANEPWKLWRTDLFPSLNDRYSPFTPTGREILKKTETDRADILWRKKLEKQNADICRCGRKIHTGIAT